MKPIILAAAALLIATCVVGCDAGAGVGAANSPDIGVVAAHLAGNKLGIKAEDLRSMQNPRGQGAFVWCDPSQFGGVNRKIIWLVLKGQAIPLNGATKGSVTPSLPWPRDVPEDLWSLSGLDAYSPADALAIVFGESQ